MYELLKQSLRIPCSSSPSSILAFIISLWLADIFDPTKRLGPVLLQTFHWRLHSEFARRTSNRRNDLTLDEYVAALRFYTTSGKLGKASRFLFQMRNGNEKQLFPFLFQIESLLHKKERFDCKCFQKINFNKYLCRSIALALKYTA